MSTGIKNIKVDENNNAFVTSTKAEGEGSVFIKVGSAGEDIRFRIYYTHQRVTGHCRCDGILLFSQMILPK